MKQSKYALWEDIDEAAARPVLFGERILFALSGSPDARAADYYGSAGALKAAMSRETSVSFPIDTSGSKTTCRAGGSAMSYGKRYAATAILNIVTRGQDDDGKAAGAVRR